MRRLLGQVAVSLALCGVASALAFTVESLSVRHDENNYSITFAVALAADSREVRKLLADYAMWPKLSSIITDSQRIDVLPSGMERIGITFRTCLVGQILCKTIRQVKDLEHVPGAQAFVTTMVPEQSDFASGSERWEIQDQGKDKTRLTYSATLVPSFRIPPVVGPWLLMRALRAELVATAEKVEALAGR